MNISNIYNIALMEIVEDIFKNTQLRKKHFRMINCGFSFVSGDIDYTYNRFLCFRRVLVVSAALNERPFWEQCSLRTDVLLR